MLSRALPPVLRVASAVTLALGFLLLAARRQPDVSRAAAVLVTLLIGIALYVLLPPLAAALWQRLPWEAWLAPRSTSLPDSERGVAAGVIAGAVRGALASLFTAAVVWVISEHETLSFLALFALFIIPPSIALAVEWRNPSLVSLWYLRAASQGWIAVWGPGFAIPLIFIATRLDRIGNFDWVRWSLLFPIAAVAGAAISALESASARSSIPWTRALLRVLAGAAPGVAFAFLVTREILHSGVDSTTAIMVTLRRGGSEIVFELGALGGGIALGELFAGTPIPGASFTDRAVRGAKLASACGLAVAIALLVVMELSPLVLPAVWFACALLVFGIFSIQSVGLVLARPISLRIARRIEPGHAWLDRRDRGRLHTGHVVAAEEALRAGRTDEAFQRGKQALELSTSERSLADERREDARRVIELILDEERFELLAELPRELPELPIANAEIHRLRRDPEAAIALLRGLLERRALGVGLHASAHAVLAMAEADRGQIALARSELAGLRVASTVLGPLLARHGLARVSGYVEFRATP
jgi:hypothetical protein